MKKDQKETSTAAVGRARMNLNIVTKKKSREGKKRVYGGGKKILPTNLIQHIKKRLIKERSVEILQGGLKNFMKTELSLARGRSRREEGQEQETQDRACS